MRAWKFVRALMVVAGLGACVPFAEAQTVEDRTQDKVAFPAHKMVGNIYGPSGISVGEPGQDRGIWQ